MRNKTDIKNIIMLIVIAVLIIVIGVLVYLYYFGDNFKWPLINKSTKSPTVTETPEPAPTETPKPTPYPVNKEGNTIKDRFVVPEGYERIGVEEGSFAYFLRNHALKSYGSTANTFEGIANDEADIAGVFNQEITPRDLQQRAQAIMRLRAEYLYSIEAYDQISFDFYTTPVFKFDFVSWASGKQLKVDGNEISWVESSTEDDYSYGNFRKYNDLVHAFANTVTLQLQMNSISAGSLSIGDVFIMSASQIPNKDIGLSAIVVDMAVHKETGEKIFLVAQGSTPTTETYIVLNDDEMMGAWHKLNDNNEYVNDEWVCPPSYFRRF